MRDLAGPYQLVLMTRPISHDGPVTGADATGRGPSLGEGPLETGAIVVVGHSKRVQLADTYGSLSRTDARRYGDSMVDFFVKEG